MGIFRKSKGVFSSVFDFRVDRWMSLGYISETSQRLKSQLIGYATPQKAKRSESFEEAMQRLGLTEADVAARKSEFKRLVTIFVTLTLLVLGYGVYLVFKGSIFPAFVSFALSFFTLAQAFRYHFWLFQIRKRKLGCTLKEWFNDKIIEDTLNEADQNQK